MHKIIQMLIIERLLINLVMYMRFVPTNNYLYHTYFQANLSKKISIKPVHKKSWLIFLIHLRETIAINLCSFFLHLDIKIVWIGTSNAINDIGAQLKRNTISFTFPTAIFLAWTKREELSRISNNCSKRRIFSLQRKSSIQSNALIISENLRSSTLREWRV